MNQPQKRKFTSRDFENAQKDALQLSQSSSIFRVLLVNMIVARRLYMVARSSLDNEITQNWDVTNPGLVAETLVQSAQVKAMENFHIRTLRDDILHTAFMFMDVLVQQMDTEGEHIYDQPSQGEPHASDQNPSTGPAADDPANPSDAPAVLSGSSDPATS